MIVTENTIAILTSNKPNLSHTPSHTLSLSSHTHTQGAGVWLNRSYHYLHQEVSEVGIGLLIEPGTSILSMGSSHPFYLSAPTFSVSPLTLRSSQGDHSMGPGFLCSKGVDLFLSQPLH